MYDLSERRNVVLAVTGSIAAYKAVELARLFVSRGYLVKVVMTEGAKEFITPLTFQAITGSAVMTSFWGGEAPGEYHGIEHISLADWAEVVVVAPATADTLAKMVMGAAENPLQATILATKAPVVVAPAMNVNMLTHPATVANLAALVARGVQIVQPEEGELACGWTGSGRLADPNEIFVAVRRALSVQDYAGKKVLISTGPTREAIDPVRFISNRSSGKMGAALAHEAYRRGAEVTVVHGPMRASLSRAIKTVPITSAQQMADSMFELWREADIVVMAAAVADFMPGQIRTEKIKHGELTRIELVENLDILATMGERRGEDSSPTLVGFAVETGELNYMLDELERKMMRKRADMIVGNLAEEAFDVDTNRVWMINKAGRREEVATTFKWRVANRVLDAILKL